MPHYKNGREAKYGDPVVGRPYNGPLVQVGNLIDIQPSSGSCNAILVRAIGSDMSCVSVGDFYHAEDAYDFISQPIQSPPATSPNVVLGTITTTPLGTCICEATAAAE